MKPTEGIAGYVFSTGQGLSMTDVASDPRFDLEAAERTGCRPALDRLRPAPRRRGLDRRPRVLDKRGSPSFSLRDMELLAIFARQATTAITATRVQRDWFDCLRESCQTAGDSMSDEQVETVVSAATRRFDDDPDAGPLALVDHVALMRGLGERDRNLVGDILAVVARDTHSERADERDRPRPSGMVGALSNIAGLARRMRLRGISREWAWAAPRARDPGRHHRQWPRGRSSQACRTCRRERRVELDDDEANVVPDDGQDLYGTPRPVAGSSWGWLPTSSSSRSGSGRRPAWKGGGVHRRPGMGDRPGDRRPEPEPLLEERDALPGVHDLVDRAYFKRIVLVSAANNVPAASYPSLFSSVLSVAAHGEPDPLRLYYNSVAASRVRRLGVDVLMAWKDGGSTVATGTASRRRMSPRWWR